MPRNPALLASKDHVIKALEYLMKSNDVLIPSTGYDLVYKGKFFPPKEVIRWALKLANIKGWNEADLYGGTPTNSPLQKLGFQITSKNNNKIMVPINKIAELKSRYNEFKERAPFYKTRIKQLELGFVNWARNVLLETLKAPLTNERLTGLIQILKNGSKKDNIFHYLEKNIVNPKERKRIIDSYNKMGETGFTGGGKGGIVKPLKVAQLKKIQSFLLNSARVKSIDEGIELVENFESLHIPEIKHATYSAWLYYINPEIFPIKNNSNSTFIAWCEQPTNSYPVAIKLFHEVSDILGEKELGLIDAFTHVFSDEEETETDNEQNKISTMSLNTILYGPPGTGKTYHTIEKAVRIINPKFFDDEVTRGEIKNEYDRLKKERRIEFITFHQSMSYEDFIEGIKPKKPEEGDIYVKYQVEEGIFKKIAKLAEYKPTTESTTFSLSDEEFNNVSFYKISLGNTAIADDEQIYRYCIDNNYIALGWGGAIDFTGKSGNDIQLMVPAELEKFAAQAVNYFIHSLKIGDYVVVTNGNLRFRAIGKVTGEYEYKKVEGLDVQQFRTVQWLVKDVDFPVEELNNKQFSQQSIYKLNKAEIKKGFFVKSAVEKRIVKQGQKNYVLIIDEINRGNIAQIFGELITLIETDKRKGKEEELEVLLPYSKESFSVPSNLFIIGTMNTADRSVEALDTALRRRFVFEQIMPQPELVSPRALLLQLYNRNIGIGWDEEPFASNAATLYRLLGIDKSIEQVLEDQEFNSDRDYWILADFNILKDEDFTGINLENLLVKINYRIQKLLDVDHQIGHSFFMNILSIEQLYEVFYQKIIPQLQEYFYGDYGKIGLVLGSEFISYANTEEKFSFANFQYDDKDELAEKRVYTTNRFQNEKGEIDFDAFENAVKTVYL